MNRGVVIGSLVIPVDESSSDHGVGPHAEVVHGTSLSYFFRFVIDIEEGQARGACPSELLKLLS